MSDNMDQPMTDEESAARQAEFFEQVAATVARAREGEADAAGFTPGPWAVVQREMSNAYSSGMPIIRAGDTDIADIRWNGHNAKHGQANAALIAAAPDIYRVAELLAAWDRSDDDPTLISEACSLARKALRDVAALAAVREGK